MKTDKGRMYNQIKVLKAELIKDLHDVCVGRGVFDQTFQVQKQLTGASTLQLEYIRKRDIGRITLEQLLVIKATLGAEITVTCVSSVAHDIELVLR